MAERTLRNSTAPARALDAGTESLGQSAAESGSASGADRSRMKTARDESGVEAVVERGAIERGAIERGAIERGAIERGAIVRGADDDVAGSTQDDRLTVYFDGACPLCAKEIGFYQRRPGADDVCWVDISEAAGGDVAPDLPFDEAMARFHVRNPDGSLESGGAAFSRLWSEMPGFRLIGRFTRLPPIAWLLERAYRFFLRFRPRLQRLAAGRK